ncbi:hypothetical protein [Acinetobacter sp. ANC 4558]|uniref:hypothetical protein n=1 Tax=Acinetobacter sp. ANC 4558 TaxID=1977876 RepID=UPI00111C7BE4|nr:hypothetical protein [Acinetobacter sp. ANC 4558]
MTGQTFAESKISAKYDPNCDEKNEIFQNKGNIQISNRYSILSVLKLDKSRDIYILDRGFSPEKSTNCPYSDPTIHSYVFVLKKTNERPYINEKILSNMDYISDINIKKSTKGFTISFVYGQGATSETTMRFDEIKNEGFFLRKIISKKVVPDGIKSNTTIKNLPIEAQYKLSNVELHNFF